MAEDKKKNSFISIETAIALLFPIGGCLFMLNDSDPNVLYEGTTWELVGQDRCIQGASTTHAVNTTIEAGLPNIVGELDTRCDVTGRVPYSLLTSNSALRISESSKSYTTFAANEILPGCKLKMDASLSNPIYGSSKTVQPPTLCMNIWKRVA